MAENFLFLVIEHNAENLIIDHPLDLFGGAAKKLLNIEDGAHFAADFVQQKKRLRLRANPFEQARIFNGNGQAASEKSENALLFRSEIIGAIALDIQHADTLALNHERHSEFGADAINGIDVARIFGDVAYADGMSRGGRATGDSLSKRNAQIGGQVRWIADRKAVPERAVASFDQQDAKNFVVDVLLDERRGAREHHVQIEGSVHFLADFGKGGKDFGRHFGTGADGLDEF